MNWEYCDLELIWFCYTQSVNSIVMHPYTERIQVKFYREDQSDEKVFDYAGQGRKLQELLTDTQKEGWQIINVKNDKWGEDAVFGGETTYTLRREITF